MNKSFKVYLRTFIYCLAWIPAVLIIAIPALIISCLPERYRYNSRFLLCGERFFSALLLFAAGVKIKVSGLQNIPQQPVIFAMNHQSTLDILIASHSLPWRPHIWVFWYAVAKYIVMNFVFRRTQVVVDASPRKAVRAIGEAIQLCQEYPMDLMIFPEGGRYDDGTVHRFLRGVGIISCNTRRPIVPVALINPGIVNPPHTAWIYPYPVEVIVGEPMICTEGETEEQFIERLRNWFVAQEPLIRK